MPTWTEITGYMIGIAEMARDDRRGLARLDLTVRGFWRSFWVIVYTLPAQIYFWMLDRSRFLEANPEQTAGAGFIIRSFVDELVALIASLAVIGLLARPLGMSDRFVQWVIAANWLSLPAVYFAAFVAMATALLGMPDGGAFWIMLAALIGILIISFRVYRVALNDDAMLAFGVIVIFYIVSWMTMIALG